MSYDANDPFPFVPLIIIGAARSGTNILRDTLTALPGFETWPCDEINPIWRYKNTSYPSDAFPAHLASPQVKKFIRNAFYKSWKKNGLPNFLVEKTCANSLRVPFVASVTPEAKFVYIIRNGIDVLKSAERRWSGNFELSSLPYYWKKARFAPLTELVPYAWSAVRNKFSIRLGLSTKFDIWGPRFVGLDAMEDASLQQITAAQWAACVNAADHSFSQFAADRVFCLKYEDFINDPSFAIQNICSWLGIEVRSDDISRATAAVRSPVSYDGICRENSLSSETWSLLEEPMRRHGYCKG